MLDNRLQQTNTYTYCSVRKCQLQSTGTGTCNKRLAETRVAVTCIGERYRYMNNTWEKWNVDPTSLSDPSHSYICELDEAWGTPADDVKVLELSIPVAPKHSELQRVDWKTQNKNNSFFLHLQPTKSKTASKLVEEKNLNVINIHIAVTSWLVSIYLESSKDEEPSLIGFSMRSSKNLYSLRGSRLSDTTVKKVPQSFIVSLVMFSREVLKIGITQSHRAFTCSRKYHEVILVL